MKVNLLYKRMAIFVAILFVSITFVFISSFQIAYGSNTSGGSPGGTNGSESIVYLYDSDGQRTGLIAMSRGEIEMITNANAASSSIRFRTIGFNISLDPLASMPYTYATTTDKYYLLGFKGIETLAKSRMADKPLYFSNAVEKKSSIDDGIVKTQIKFNASQVEDCLSGKSFNNIVQNTPIYLHAIFETYQTINGKDVVRKPNITKWQSIVTAEYWSTRNNQLQRFAQYFNMQLEFQPRKQSTILYYVSDSGQPLKNGSTSQKKLTEVYPGETTSWTNEPFEITYNKKDYKLHGYEVYSVHGNTLVEKHSIGDSHGCTLGKIQSNSIKVQFGGMKVNLIYQEKQANRIQLRAVDMDTGKVIKENLYTGDIISNLKFSRTVDQTILYQSKNYSKSNSNSYSYTNTKNKKVESYFLIKTADGPIAFTIPADIKSGTTIVVDVYYELSGDDTIPVTVNAIDKDTGQRIMTFTSSSVKASKAFTHTVESHVTANQKTYDYIGEWKWSYKEQSNSATISSGGTGDTVSFTAPSSSRISGGITVDIYYRINHTPSGDIVLRTVLVGPTGSIIQELTKETVKRNQSIQKQMEQTKSVNGSTYQSMNQWDYTYHNGSKDTTTKGNGSKVTFMIPSTTKLGTVVLLKLYYNAVQEVEVPEEMPPIVLPLDTPEPTAVINGDKYKDGYFVSEDSIPTTESQYVYVKTKDYLLGCHIVNRVGKMTYYVPVKMNYTVQYSTPTPEEFGGPQVITDVVTDIQQVKVERAYSYWEILNFEYYIINSANVYNYSLPDGKVNLMADYTMVSVPNLVLSHSSNPLNHLKEPKQVKEGIELDYPSIIVSESNTIPIIEYEDLTSYALEMTDEILVSNDYLVFDGITVLSSSQVEKVAPYPNASPLVHSNTIIDDKTLFTENQVIEATKSNGVYASSGTVNYYRHSMSVLGSYSGKSYSMKVNNVTIHTPVICNPIINTDNEQWTQLISPELQAHQIVLDPDSSLNDFIVRISNTLEHSDLRGYTIRDFSRSMIDPESISYIAKKEGIVRNEIKFPFDVYYDVDNDKKERNDEFIKAGTWIILGKSTVRFYVPMWVQEGVYTVEFRTIAVNGEDKIKYTEYERNGSRLNYVAVATKQFQVSGRIYGLKIYDIYDYPNWETVFRSKKTSNFKYFEGAIDGTTRTNYHKDYTYYYGVGTKDQYGKDTERLSKYTIPLVNNSHPQYKNLGVLKTGYAFRFILDTTGEMYTNSNSVRIIPTFYHVDRNGKNRKQVDLYYNEEINNKHQKLIKVGEGIDLSNVKKGTVGNIYSKIPESELKHTANVLKIPYNNLITKYMTMYGYSDIRLFSDFRTYIGLAYAKQIANIPSYRKVKENAHLTEMNLSMYMQRWYGTYKLPVDLKVAPAGYDVYDHMRKHGITGKESFWLKNGYIIVNFNIITYDKNGKQNLSYINGKNYLEHGHNSMWVTEGGALEKTDHNKVSFQFKAGDAMMYYVNQSYRDDFEGVLN